MCSVRMALLFKAERNIDRREMIYSMLYNRDRSTSMHMG